MNLNMNNDLHEFSKPMSEKEKLSSFINSESPYISVDERETITINLNNTGDQIFSSEIKKHIKPFFLNLMCKIHNTVFKRNSKITVEIQYSNNTKEE